ncbi:MAG TPA: PrsW family glutamic-type intramembrane protease [Gemmatimonadota bacterium]|jgi:RsiW-degrading membrane proteinase PrsW (M82 family)
MPDLWGHSGALVLAVALALVYLILVRLADFNEREPIWSLALLFALGAFAAGILNALVPSATLHLKLWPGVLATELARFAAVGLGVAVLSTTARLRGWSELNGLMDGIIYGAAAGLGFATGEAFVRHLRPSAILAVLPVSAFGLFWTTALTGLAGGLFGALIGAGFGAASQAPTAARRIGPPVAGLAAAVLVHAGHEVLARGNALAGASAVARLWIALAVPLLAVIGLAAHALSRERLAIREELADERETGAVSDRDLALLESWPRRQSAYLAALLGGDLTRFAGLMALHNRQVMLALTKRTAAREQDPRRRSRFQAEVDHLRASVLTTKEVLQRPLSRAKR